MASQQFIDSLAEQEREERERRHRIAEYVNGLSPEARAEYEEGLALIRAMSPAERLKLLQRMNADRDEFAAGGK
jgi:hypothetical protein